MGNCCGGDEPAPTTQKKSVKPVAQPPSGSAKASAKESKADTKKGRGMKGPRPPPPTHETRPRLTETMKGLTGVIVHKDGQRMRKPAMEVKMDIPEGPGMLANPQQLQQQAEQPVKIEHILELPPKAVRGPPPLTPFPEPGKTNVVTQMADPPGGWSHFEDTSTTSTSTNDIIAKIPLLSWGMEEVPDSKGSKSGKGSKDKSKDNK